VLKSERWNAPRIDADADTDADADADADGNGEKRRGEDRRQC
jgi:hypothetical protein